eukprot:821804-Amphidinium_carterae.1
MAEKKILRTSTVQDAASFGTSKKTLWSELFSLHGMRLPQHEQHKDYAVPPEGSAPSHYQLPLRHHATLGESERSKHYRGKPRIKRTNKPCHKVSK